MLNTHSTILVQLANNGTSTNGKKRATTEDVSAKKKTKRWGMRNMRVYADNGEPIDDPALLEEICAKNLKEINGRKLITWGAFILRKFKYMTGEKKDQFVQDENNKEIKFNKKDGLLYLGKDIVEFEMERNNFKKKIDKILVETKKNENTSSDDVNNVSFSQSNDNAEISEELVPVDFSSSLQYVENSVAQLRILVSSIHAQMPFASLGVMSHYLSQVEDLCKTQKNSSVDIFTYPNPHQFLPASTVSHNPTSMEEFNQYLNPN